MKKIKEFFDYLEDLTESGGYLGIIATIAMIIIILIGVKCLMTVIQWLD
jgi:hypothetical protein